MFKSKETSWIGFQEAEKILCNIKQEVEIADEKLLHIKKTFSETSKRRILKPHLISDESVPQPEHTKSQQSKQFSHFTKETISVSPKISSINNENTTVPKEMLVTFEEEPNFRPFQYPQTEPLDFKSSLFQSSVDSYWSKLTSSTDSFPVSKVKHSSSERTSSLIESTYRDSDKFLKRHETRLKETTSDITKSVTSSTSDQENAFKKKKMHWIAKSQHRNIGDVGMEWKEVPGNKPFILHKRFHPDDMQKLKDIIDKQKKKQQQYQLQLENEFSSSNEQLQPKKTQPVKEQQSLQIVEDQQIAPVLVRKVCTVKSLPVYKGFSAPLQKIPTGTRWRKQKNKFTIAKSSNNKDTNFNSPKRIKTVVKCESDFVSASHWKEVDKVKEVHENEESLSQTVDDEPIKSSPEKSLEDPEPDTINNDFKNEVQSILKENQLLSNENSADSEEDKKNETYSNEIKLDSYLLKIDNDENSMKENKKPLKPKTARRKAKKSPEQKVIISPKIKHYDVDQIRDYMKKKKEERRKRHQDEHKKRMHEAQKKKESLEKLYEYQKMNKNAVAKVKPSPKIDLVRREIENKQVSSITKDGHSVKESAIQKENIVENRETSCFNHADYSKKEHKKESQGKDVSENNPIGINLPHKRKQENLNIDLSFPKFISVSVTPSHKHSTLKDLSHSTSYEGMSAEVKRIVTKTNEPVESTVQEISADRMKKHSLTQQKVEDVDMEDSCTFKIKDMFRSISTVSTPSSSYLKGAENNCCINGEGLTDMETTKLPSSKIKSKKVESLKDLMKSINMLTEPLEPLLRTSRWVEGNPLPPPSVSKKRVTDNTDLSNKQELELPVRDTDFHVERSKSLNSGMSSFREQVAGIGDVNQFFAQILGRNPTETEQIIERTCKEDNHPVSNLNETEDEIIEGSLLSADEYVINESQRNLNHPSVVSTNSSHFSDLQKKSVIPDHFNLINTWKRKPLGVHNGKDNKTENVSGPSKVSKNCVFYEEIYKSMISTNSSDVHDQITDNKITEIEGSFLSHSMEQMSFTSGQFSVQDSISRGGTSSEILSKMSSATNLSNDSFEDSSESHCLKSNKSERHSLSNEASHENIISVKGSNISNISESYVNSSKLLESQRNTAHFSALNDEISEQLHKSNSDLYLSDGPEKIIYETINSEYTVEIGEEMGSLIPGTSEKHTLNNTASHKSFSGLKNSGTETKSDSFVDVGKQSESYKNAGKFSAQNNAISEQLCESNPVLQVSDEPEEIIYETINSDYAFEIDGEDSKKEENEVGEFYNKAVTDRVSASGSSISEVISVVENSKGFRSSVEDLQSNRSVHSSNSSDVCTNIPTPHSVKDKSNSNDKESLRSTTNKSSKQQIKRNSEQKSTSTTSESTLRDSRGSVLLLKHDQLGSIELGSQNSVALDIRQPLGLQLSNGESVQSNQGYENQYLHTQVVTRVASEAAAAAATSAVIAVFETQRALLAKKNYRGLINPYGRSGSNKRTHYSTDFESSQAAKSSINSPESSAVESKYSKSVLEDISGESNNELSSRNGSIEERVISRHSDQDQIVPLKSPQSTPTNSDQNVASVHSQEILSGNQKTPQRSKRKISSNMSSPSPASLSENESVSSETLMSSHSDFSHLSESALSDDSFAQLTDVVHRMAHEDVISARQQLSLLQLKETTAVEKARSDMMWLECVKKKLRKKGAESEVSYIKKRQKEIILRLRNERFHLQCLQEAYRNICENRHSLSEDKKKLLKEQISLAFQLPSSSERPLTYKYNEGKMKELPKQKSPSSTPTIVSDNDTKTLVDEESVSEVPEIVKGLASNSSQESVIETQASEAMKTSNSQNKSLRSSSNTPFPPLNAAQSNSNPSLHSSNSLESALQGLKKLEASKRHLAKREQRLLQRKKDAESLLQLKVKIDNEEKAVRELEQKIVDEIGHSKKRPKCYISSSSSAYQDDDKIKMSVYGSFPYPVKVPSEVNELCKTMSEQSTSENKIPRAAYDESIPANLTENELKLGSEKYTSSAPSSDSLSVEIKSASMESSIKTIDATESGSQIDEIMSEVSHHISPTAKDKSSNSEIYSESFESIERRKSPSVLSNSSPIKNSSLSISIKKDCGIGIRLPLVPRNVRRHDSSGSDDSYTISQSETASDQSDIEVRIHALTEKLKRCRAEAEKLKREQKKKTREHLKEKELSLQKQLEAYNLYINQAKLDLEHQIGSAVSPSQASHVVVKPRIKWPRPEQVIDSRRVRKHASLSTDSFVIEKKYELVNSSPENTENSAAATKENVKVVRKLFSDPVQKIDDECFNKEALERSEVDSRELSEVLSATNSSEIQELSEIERSRSFSSEVSSDIKEVPDANGISENSSIKLTEVKSSDSDQKQPSVVSSIDEKSSPDTIESKSQTDTFITESSSSKSLDLNSTTQQSDDSNASNRTVSSDDEQSTRVIKEVSGEINQKSDTLSSHNISQESSSSENSISEVLSIINSASPEEDLENENSIKKCNNPDGCKTPPKNEFNNLESKPQQLCVTPGEKQPKPSTTQSSDLVPLGNKKLFPSEPEILNIVNYLYYSLVDDAFQTFYKISKKCTLKTFLNAKTCKRKDPLRTHKLKKSAAEELSVSLYNAYLNDALDSFFGNIKGLKNYMHTTTLCSKSNVSSEQDIAGTSLSNVFNNNFVMKNDDDNEFPVNYVTQDLNKNQVFTKSSDWNADNFGYSQKQIQDLEQQLVFQQYSYFYRKIPNKPPPPYTPPSSATISFEFPVIKDTPKEKVTTVKEVTRHIEEVVDQAVELLLDGKQRGLPLSDICLPSEGSIADKLELTVPNQAIFIDLVFDLTKEIVLEQYSETKECPQPWLQPQKLTPKPLIPSSRGVISSSVQKEIKKVLKINVSPPSINQRKQVFWSSLKLGRKKRDFVDTILISELKQEEPDWVNYDQDEVTVKMQIADSIFKVLISDTISVIKELQLKMDNFNS